MNHIYPYQKIREWCDNKYIKNFDIENIQSCSLDIRIKCEEPIIIKKNQIRHLDIYEKISDKLNNLTFIMYSAKSTTARNFIKTSYNFNKNKLKVKPLAYDIILNDKDKLGQFYFINYLKSNKTSIALYLDHVGYTLNDDKVDLKLISEFNTTQHYLMKSLNEIKLANDEVGILNKYSTKENVITHINAGFFDSGFKGKAVFEIINSSCKNIDLNIWKNDTFTTLDIYNLTEPTEKPYNNNYQNQGSYKSILPVKNFIYIK